MLKCASDFTAYGMGLVNLSNNEGPVVLILHTHGTEAYSEKGAISYLESGELARSNDTSKNVVAVGEAMAQYLNKNGVPTVHCSVMHDQVQYKDSYNRAEETIKQYLEMYPTIKLVIDLHRDSIVKSSGELVRPVTLVGDTPAAQVMCVVGSDSRLLKPPLAGKSCARPCFVNLLITPMRISAAPPICALRHITSNTPHILCSLK